MIYDFLKNPQVPRALAHPVGPTGPRTALPSHPEGTAGDRAEGPTTPGRPCPSSVAATAPTAPSTTLTKVTSTATTRGLVMTVKNSSKCMSDSCPPHLANNNANPFSDGPLQRHQDRGQRRHEPPLQRPSLRSRPLRDVQRRRDQQQLVPPRPHHGRAGLQHADSGNEIEIETFFSVFFIFPSFDW